jgi:hypothetical protein
VSTTSGRCPLAATPAVQFCSLEPDGTRRPPSPRGAGTTVNWLGLGVVPDSARSYRREGPIRAWPTRPIWVAY